MPNLSVVSSGMDSVVPDDCYGGNAQVMAAMTAHHHKVRQKPTHMDDEAFHGIAGAVVNTLDPHTEGTREAMLIQYLTLFGCSVGRSPHWVAGVGSRHGMNLYAAVVGPSSDSRKGAGLDAVKPLFTGDQEFRGRMVGGIQSGEGIIHAIRDPSKATEKDKNGAEKEVDPGVADKRLMIIETEFDSLLSVLKRQGSRLTGTLRDAWDSGSLGTTQKQNAEKCDEPHVSLIGHVTDVGLTGAMSDTDAQNGFGNRFMWVWSESKKMLPEGGSLPFKDLLAMREGTQAAAAQARHVERMGMSDAAWDLWGRNSDPHGKLYAEMRKGRPGLAGNMLRRGPPIVRRLACIYALLDMAADVEVEHLRAAHAVWRYVIQTVEWVFADGTGRRIADDIMVFLEEHRTEGITRTEIRDHFGRSLRESEIKAALEFLEENKHARVKRESTGGRPRERWFPLEKAAQ